MEHQWAEYRFDPQGSIAGVHTVVQTWKCKKCGQEVDLPAFTSPNDYFHNGCHKKEVVPVPKKKWVCPNKRDYPAKKARCL